VARTNLGTPEEALAGMANNGRQPMGMSFFKADPVSSTDIGRATLVPKNSGKSQDPYLMANPQRNPVMYERNGAKYGVQVNITQPVMPEAGATQANGKIVPCCTKRSNDSFVSGMTSYAK